MAGARTEMTEGCLDPDLVWALDLLDKLLAITGIVLTKESRERMERLRNARPS